MAISMKNLDDRLKALENSGGSGIVESKLANPGFIKFGNGVIINFGRITSSGSYRTMTFPKAYTTTPVVTISAFCTSNGWYDDRSIIGATSKTGFGYVWREDANSIFGHSWIAIGYLISDRILNNIYSAITHLFRGGETIWRIV